MTATVLQLPTGYRPQDPALHAALAELLKMGLVVARVSARLAEVEDGALEAVAVGAVEAARALAVAPGSLGEAIRAGQDADVSDAARDAIVRRVGAITDSFDKAARAVRRTVALQARLASGRLFNDAPPPGRAAGPHAATGARPGSDAEPAERGDRIEAGDELGAETDERVVDGIRRDLDDAATNVMRLKAGAAPKPVPAAEPGDLPGEDDWPTPLPAPDT